MSKPIEITGMKFGRLTVLKYVGTVESARRYMCRCDCGKEIVARSKSLRTGNTKSCGCYAQEVYRSKNNKHRLHGLTKTRVWITWDSMKQRCLNRNSPIYSNYGGRGVKICAFILASVENLISVIGDRPLGKSLDRINNDGNYSCGSCEECVSNGWPHNIKWSTGKEQAANRRTSHLLTINGRTMTVTEWAESHNIPTGTLFSRVYNGIPEHRLLAPSARRPK